MPNGNQLFESAAYAFRGYNVTNLGRTGELLDHTQFGPTVERHQRSVSTVASAAPNFFNSDFGAPMM
jgi:hypothetical protein